jgi:hypothetical protein
VTRIARKIKNKNAKGKITNQNSKMEESEFRS